MTSERQRLRPWLEDMINSGEVPGLSWEDSEKTRFRVSWKHAGKPDFKVDRDAVLFRKWAEHTGKYRRGESPDPSTWKTRFRCALHKMPDIDEIKVAHSLDGENPYRVFQFKPKGTASSPRDSISSPSTASSPTTPPRKAPFTLCESRNPFPEYGRSHELPSVYLSRNASIDEGVFDPPSDDSFDEIDAITPTLIPEQSLPNGMFGCVGYVEAQMRMNGEMSNNTPFDNTLYPYMPTQQAISTSWLKFLVTDQEYSHMNGYQQQNGSYSEPLPMELPIGHRFPFQTEQVVSGNDSTTGAIPIFKPSASVNAQDRTMEITIFYDRKEIESLEITKQDSDRTVRLSTASPEKLAPRFKYTPHNDLYNAIYGPMNAKQVVLPPAKTSNETQTVLDNMTRGLILHMTEEGDVYASRLCLSRVFCTNGTNEATKLHRQGRIKVFDYQKVFLPKLRMSISGNCATPSYDITFNLGRADGSLVAIVVTHAQAKKQVDQVFCSVERFVSEPNPEDHMLDSQEEMEV